MKEEIYHILRQFFRGEIGIEEAAEKLEDLLKLKQLSRKNLMIKKIMRVNQLYEEKGELWIKVLDKWSNVFRIYRFILS